MKIIRIPTCQYCPNFCPGAHDNPGNDWCFFSRKKFKSDVAIPAWCELEDENLPRKGNPDEKASQYSALSGSIGIAPTVVKVTRTGGSIKEGG